MLMPLFTFCKICTGNAEVLYHGRDACVPAVLVDVSWPGTIGAWAIRGFFFFFFCGASGVESF